MQLSDASVYNADRRDKAPRVSESCLSSFFFTPVGSTKTALQKRETYTSTEE